MVCIYCGASTQVINSRLQKRLNQVWRRRRCASCDNIFTTHELVELGTSVMVKHQPDLLEPFNRELLFVSIYESCKHRPAAAEDAASLMQTVLAFLHPQIVEGSLDREQIVEAVLAVLERFDRPAATMYKAYHPPKINVVKRA